MLRVFKAQSASLGRRGFRVHKVFKALPVSLALKDYKVFKAR